MAGIINYSSTIFIEPEPISNQKYLYLKYILKNDKFYQISTPNETFFEKFKSYIISIIIGIVGVIITYFIDKLFWPKGNKLEWLNVLFGIVAIASFIMLCIEGTSYLTFLNKKGNYYLRLKYTIIISKDLHDYQYLFYTKQPKEFQKKYKKWKKEFFKSNSKSTQKSSTLSRIR